MIISNVGQPVIASKSPVARMQTMEYILARIWMHGMMRGGRGGERSGKNLATNVDDAGQYLTEPNEALIWGPHQKHDSRVPEPLPYGLIWLMTIYDAGDHVIQYTIIFHDLGNKCPTEQGIN